MKIAVKTGKKSISKYWFLNVFTVMAAAITVVEVVVCIVIQNRVYSSVRTAAEEKTRGLSLLATCDYSVFDDVARSYIESFEYKDYIEVQIIDRDGRRIVTSNGFEPSAEDMPDYRQAKQSGGTAEWHGRNSRREPVMAETSILTDFGSGSNGAVRWIVSLSAANRRVFVLCFISILVGAGLLGFSWLSGMYFIRSIVRPVQEVSRVAQKIALGDFESRIDSQSENEIGELCDSINYMASELKSVENMKNDFISSVSHELRTPLTAIRGWGETARMAVGSDDEIVIKGLEVVLSESERLSGLVEELLDFSRMQSGRLSLETSPVPVGDVLRDAVEMYVELARQQEIELSYLPPQDKILVEGDRDKLKQVFINIIDNAIKYTQKGGHVIISQYSEDGVVLTKVSDSGEGIPAQDLDRVKEKFFKSNKKVRGSGIGLAVADEIVKQHSGLLFIESKEGVGTTVTVALPLYNPVEEKTEEIIPPAAKEEIKENGENPENE